jgi:hypothetical protein
MIAGVREKDLVSVEDVVRREVEVRKTERENIFMSEEHLPIEQNNLECIARALSLSSHIRLPLDSVPIVLGREPASVKQA